MRENVGHDEPIGLEMASIMRSVGADCRASERKNLMQKVMRWIGPGVLVLGATGALAQNIQGPYVLNTELTGLTNPLGLAVDAQERVFVADSATGRILRGQGGQSASYSQLISGFTVGPYFGNSISALGLHIGSDQTLWIGEGGRATAGGANEPDTDRVFRYSLDGALLQTMNSASAGGNYYGITSNPLNGDVYALSANGDKIYRASALSGGSYSDFQEIADTGVDGYVSPVAAVVKGNTLFVAAFPGVFQPGVVMQYGLNGNLINADFSTGYGQLTAMALDVNGDLLVGEYGSPFTAGQASLWRVNSVTGDRTLIGSDFGHITAVAVAADGTIYITDQVNQYLAGSTNPPNQGKVYRIETVPEPATIAALGIGLAALRRRRRPKASS